MTFSLSGKCSDRLSYRPGTGWRCSPAPPRCVVLSSLTGGGRQGPARAAPGQAHGNQARCWEAIPGAARMGTLACRSPSGQGGGDSRRTRKDNAAALPPGLQAERGGADPRGRESPAGVQSPLPRRRRALPGGRRSTRNPGRSPGPIRFRGGAGEPWPVHLPERRTTDTIRTGKAGRALSRRRRPPGRFIPQSGERSTRNPDRSPGPASLAGSPGRLAGSLSNATARPGGLLSAPASRDAVATALHLPESPRHGRTGPV